MKAVSQSRVGVSRCCVVVVIVHALAGPPRACPPEHLEGNGAEEGGGKDKEEGTSAWKLGAGARALVFLPPIPILPKLSLISDYKISCLFP